MLQTLARLCAIQQLQALDDTTLTLLAIDNIKTAILHSAHSQPNLVNRYTLAALTEQCLNKEIYNYTGTPRAIRQLVHNALIQRIKTDWAMARTSIIIDREEDSFLSLDEIMDFEDYENEPQDTKLLNFTEKSVEAIMKVISDFLFEQNNTAEQIRITWANRIHVDSNPLQVFNGIAFDWKEKIANDLSLERNTMKALPVQLWAHISEYLGLDSLLLGLAFTCKHFCIIVHSEEFWGFIKHLSLDVPLSLAKTEIWKVLSLSRELKSIRNIPSAYAEDVISYLVKFSKNLKSVNLSRMKDLKSGSLKRLISGCNLINSINLDFCYDAVISQGIWALTDTIGDQLSELSIYGCPNIGAYSFDKLLTCNNLINVNLGCRYDQDKQHTVNKLSKDQLSSILKNWTGLVALDLSFRCPSYENGEVAILVSDLLNSFERLEELKLCGWKGFSGSGVIECKKHLKEIDFSWSLDLDDDFIIKLAKSCRFMKKVTLRRCNMISDASIENLSLYCPEINFLNLSACSSLTVEGLSFLHRFSSLKELLLDFLPIGDDSIGLLVSIPNLAMLSMEHCNRLTNQALNLLGYAIFSISNLNISKCPLMKFSGFDAFSRTVSAKSLNTLRISGIKGITADSLLTLQEFGNLKILDLSDCDLRSDSFKFLTASKWSSGIYHLNVSSNHLINIETCICLSSVFTKLKELIISWNPRVCNQSIEALCKMDYLSILDLSGCSSITTLDELKRYFKRSLYFKKLLVRSIADKSLHTEIVECQRLFPRIVIES
jgi:hypothetical protein